MNGINTEYFHELQNVLAANAGQQVRLTVEAKERTRNLEATVRKDSTLGFMANRTFEHLNLATINYSLAQAVPKGTERAFNIVFLNIKAFGKIFSGELNFSKSVSGPIGIAREFGGQWNWPRFWTLVGLLSMILAFMNFLPIPALDGGHVMFLTFEMVSGHKPSDKFMENAQKVGMVILLSLMVFIIFNDIFKAIV